MQPVLVSFVKLILSDLLRQISNKSSATLLSTNRIDDYIATKSRQNLKIKNEQAQKPYWTIKSQTFKMHIV